MLIKSLQWLWLGAALVALPIQWASAQQSPHPNYASIVREGYRLGKAEADKLEAALEANPDDLTARTKLLGFYYRRPTLDLLGPEATLAARRRHILWLIEHRPESEAAGLADAVIDRAVHPLADQDGYEQAAKLWMQKVQLAGNNTRVLGNAARFFQLSDRERAEAILKQAQQVAPKGEAWGASLGYVYAVGILGVDMITQNGLPVSFNPAEAKGEFARRAREELERSADAGMVGTAGMILSQYGAMLEGMSRRTERPFTVDYAPLAEALLMKAQELDPASEPANKVWSEALEQFHKLRLQLGHQK